MLPLLHSTAIAAAIPKWVVGFSDVTSLFAYLSAQAGVSVLHGPCLAAPSAITSPRKADNVNALHEALFDPDSRPRYAGKWIHPTSNGAPITGRLVGGCLSVVVTSLGTPWQVDMRDAILFLEDTGEAPYRIDRMITHLRTAGMLTHLRGIVFGHLHKCDSDPPGLLQDVLLDLFRDAPFPVVTGVPCGHGDLNLPLELGAEYELVAEGEGASLRKR
jgi:muramoyltetrapeptide carboxypeptidase